MNLLEDCLAKDPDGRPCGLDPGHVGAHENWYGSWYGGVWLTHYVEVAAR